jgi:hypothetical protein
MRGGYAHGVRENGAPKLSEVNELQVEAVSEPVIRHC